MSEPNDQAPPIASALVIGVGGSGVHTLGRLRAAVRDASRPGVVAVDNVKFLAIDAVEQNAQLPALPPGAGLAAEEFLNIASTPINAYEYVRRAWQHDDTLRSSWDSDYIPPNQALTDGMKRSRPLGNLVFRVQADKVVASLRRLLDEVVALNPDQYRRGSDSSRARVPVFIAASSAGGTGSSGFLHVLHAIHRAAVAAGVDLAVYPVIFLPDVFASARVGSLDPQMEERAHWSNAYAFFSELDYVISEPRAFDTLLCPSDEMPTEVQAIDVVETVFLIDGKLTDGSQIEQQDAYDLAASGLHSLLLTKTRKLLGAAGTNTDNKGFDALDPPQRTAYSTMGAFRTVFPGSTYRRYSRARLRAHLVQDYLLDESHSTNEVERGQRIITSLVDGIWGLRTTFDEKARSLRSVQDLLARAANVESELDDRDVAQAVVEHVSAVMSDGERVSDELAGVLPAQTRAAMDQIPAVVDEVIRSSGEGLKVLRYAVRRAQLALSEQADTSRGSNQASRQSLTNLRQQDRDGSLNDHARRVQQASTRNFLVRKGELSESVKGYSDAVQQFATKLLRAHISQAELDVAKAAVLELDAVADALESASKVLRDQKSRSDSVWQNDDLDGKDAGSKALMALIPSDVLPQVEDSAVAVAVWARILKHLESVPGLNRDPREASGAGPTQGREWVRRVYETWWKEGESHTVRGLVALGQGESDAVSQTRSAEILNRILNHEVETLAQLEDVMPADLESAAALADAVASGDVLAESVEGSTGGEETRQLWTALEETLKKADFVALQIDRARIKLQGDAAVPEPVVQIMATGPMLLRVEDMLPRAEPVDSTDSEQVTTLAVQRGFPISAVRGLDMWQRAHRRVSRDRSRYLSKSIDPPPYLDKKFEAAAAQRPLVRRLYNDAPVAELVVQGTALMRLVDNDSEAIHGMGLVSPLAVRWQGAKAEVVATPLSIQDGEIRPNGDPVIMGTSAPQVFDTLAEEVSVQRGISAVFDSVLNRAQSQAASGDSRLLDALADEIEQYRHASAELAKALPTDNPTDGTERERDVRRVIDSAAMAVLADVKAPPRPARPAPQI